MQGLNLFATVDLELFCRATCCCRKFCRRPNTRCRRHKLHGGVPSFIIRQSNLQRVGTNVRKVLRLMLDVILTTVIFNTNFPFKTKLNGQLSQSAQQGVIAWMAGWAPSAGKRHCTSLHPLGEGGRKG